MTLEGAELDAAGLLVDFVDVKKLMHEVIDRLDHQLLNDVPPFDVLNPSAENMAKYIYEEMSKGLAAGTAVRRERREALGNRHSQRDLPAVNRIS